VQRFKRMSEQERQATAQGLARRRTPQGLRAPSASVRYSSAPITAARSRRQNSIDSFTSAQGLPFLLRGNIGSQCIFCLANQAFLQIALEEIGTDQLELGFLLVDPPAPQFTFSASGFMHPSMRLARCVSQRVHVMITTFCREHTSAFLAFLAAGHAVGIAW
jgi:hypothetical protein